ncbi:MAG: translocation/assembly module TamB [Treponema sp.]|nr:translocation/assembly module TamB [Treponema sp.]
MYRVIDSFMHKAESDLLSEFSTKTNLSISYDSLSPSILTGITIKNIRVFEISTGDEILYIKKVSIYYNILNALKKDFDHIFSKVVISGVQFQIDRNRYHNFFDKIKKLSSDSKEKELKIQTDDSKVLTEDQKNLVKKIMSALPADIQIKDISALYNDLNKSVSIKVNKINLFKQWDGNVSVKCTSGYVLTVLSSSKTKTVGVRFNFSGKIVNGFSGSSMIISFDQYQKADVTLYKAQFLIHYRNNCLYVRSTQQSMPYTVFARYDFNSEDLSLDLDVRDLKIPTVLKFSVSNKKIQDLLYSGITFKGTFKANAHKKNYSWNGSGSVTLPKSILSGEENIQFNALGNNSRIKIQSLTAKGSVFDGYASGVYDIGSYKPSGSVVINKLTLPNGNNISGEIYVEAQNRKVMAFMPQLYLGKQKFTAIEVTAIPSSGKVPFSLEMEDYSHLDYGKPAEIKISGTYITGKNKNLSATLSIDNLFLDSVAHAASFFSKKEKQKKIEKIAEKLYPYITSDEISFSTDFKGISFNAPFSLIANTSKNKQMAFFAFEGNERSVKISDFNIIFGKHNVQAKFEVDISPEDRQAVFSSSFEINNIPYNLNGSYTLGKWINIQGSYGIDVIANIEDGFYGTAKISSLPIAVSKLLFKISTETEFRCKSLNDFIVNITSLQIELEEHKLDRSPKLAFMGSVDPEGIIFNAINFSDVSTSSSGSGYVRWNVDDGILNSVNVSIATGNELTSEVFSLDGTFSNPLKKTLSKNTIMKDCYFNAVTQIKNLPLIRFVPKQYADDTFNGTILASGTVENPYISINIDSLSAQYGTKPVIVKGKAELIEGNVSVPDFKLSWGNVRLSDVKGTLNIKEFNATATGNLFLSVLGGRIVNIPLDIEMKNTDESFYSKTGKKKFVPKSFLVTGKSNVSAKGLINGNIPVNAELRKDGRKITFASDKSMGVTGSYILKEGTFTCNIPSGKPLHGNAKGLIRKGKIDLTISDIFCNFGQFKELINTDFFAVYDGILSGRVYIAGLTSDPTFDGALLTRNFEFNLPLAIPAHMRTKNLLITFDDKQLEVTESKFLVSGDILSASALLVLDRWGVSSFSLNAKTLDDGVLPVKMNVPNVGINGNASARFELLYSERVLSMNVKGLLNDSDLHILNKIFPSNDMVKKVSDENKESFFASLTKTMDVVINVDAIIGRKVYIVINPFLRALITPNTKFHFDFDSGKGVWNLKSDVVLRGGQITYLTRNFYIKNGRITLNESQNGFNPFITLNAETRERDENNIPVTIVLSSENQPLANFRGRVYSIPARSETQIMAMLGQIATGDSSDIGGFFLSGLDYGMHVTVLRKIENSLRDLFNFDIFSIRVNVLQNSLKYGFASNSSSGTEDAIFRNPIGNYLDNSSVYIGKYFGSSIYADVLLQWSYDEVLARKSKFVGSGLVFHPEIGLEFDAPFAKIRWNFAPDLTALHNGEVPSIVSGTSVTLSWRITF